MGSDFINFLQNNWSIIKTAPVAFITIGILGIVLGVLIGKWRYDGIIQAMNERNSGITQALNERIEGLNDRLKARDEQLEDRNFLVDEYRQRLSLLPSTGKPYTRLTHGELKAKVIDFVSEFREFVVQTNSASDNVSRRQFQEMKEAKTEEERNRIWDKYTNQLLQQSSRIITEYNSRFRIDAIIFRDEMLSRLPKDTKDQRTYTMYEYANNYISMNMIVDDLERMAKILQ